MGRFGFALGIILAGLVVASMAMVVAVAFGCLSLYLYFVTVTTPALAALFVALASLSFALIVVAALRLAPKPRLRMLIPPEYDVLGRLSEAAGMGRALGDEGRAYLKSNLSGASFAAFAFGVAMGISPRLRKLVLGLLKP